MKPLHILHSEAAVGWGGQEIRVFQESRYLAENGHRVSIVCQPESPLAKRCEKYPHPNLACYPVKMTSPVSPGDFISVYRQVKRLRPDLVHTHSSIDSWLVSFSARALGIPIVRSRHVSIPVKNFFPRNWVYTGFPKRIITSGEAVSEVMRGLNGIKPARVTCISAGVDMRRFDCKISGQAIRDELKLSPEQTLVGKVGVVRSWKGHGFFLQAVEEIAKEFPGVCFAIVGDGPGFAQMKQKAADLNLPNRVFVLGHREDVPEIMAALDVLVLASTAGEGTPQVIPQAFAMKTPVVATRIGAIPDLLGEGERGVLVEPANGSALAAGVAEALRDPDARAQRAEKAREFCRRELTFEMMMDKTLRVYREVLEENPTR